MESEEKYDNGFLSNSKKYNLHGKPVWEISFTKNSKNKILISEAKIYTNNKSVPMSKKYFKNNVEKYLFFNPKEVVYDIFEKKLGKVAFNSEKCQKADNELKILSKEVIKTFWFSKEKSLEMRKQIGFDMKKVIQSTTSDCMKLLDSIRVANSEIIYLDLVKQLQDSK